MLAAVNPVIENLEAVLADSGYYSAAAVAAVEQPSGVTVGPMIYAATGRPGPRSQRQGEDEASPRDKGGTRTLRTAQTNH